MHFTKYYSGVINSNGVPSLSLEQHCRLMNIISLEGQLNALEQLKKSQKQTDGYHIYDIKIHRIQQKLKGLTLDQYPKEVLSDMVFRSEKDIIN